jgi:hypothetical protein
VQLAGDFVGTENGDRHTGHTDSSGNRRLLFCLVALKEMRKDRAVSFFWEISLKLDEVEIRNTRRFIYDELLGIDPASLPYQEREKINIAISRFTHVASLWKRNLVPEDLIFETYGQIVPKMWNGAEQYIMQ